MNAHRLTTRGVATLTAALLWFHPDGSALHAQDGKPKELGGAADNLPIELLLGKTPKLSFLFSTGQGLVVTQVVVQPAEKADTFKAKIVSLARLWKDDKQRDYEYRTTPQIKQVPFDDENGVTWSLLDGAKWKLGDEFLISRKNLQDRVRAVPAYKADGRNWFQKIGATNAVEGMEAALKVVEATKASPKK